MTIGAVCLGLMATGSMDMDVYLADLAALPALSAFPKISPGLSDRPLGRGPFVFRHSMIQLRCYIRFREGCVLENYGVHGTR